LALHNLPLRKPPDESTPVDQDTKILTRIWHVIMCLCSWWSLFIGSQCGFIVVDVIFYMGPWDQNSGNFCSTGTFSKEPCYIVCGEESTDDSGRSSSRIGPVWRKCMLLNITIPFELQNTCKAELITFCMWELQINHSLRHNECWQCASLLHCHSSPSACAFLVPTSTHCSFRFLLCLHASKLCICHVQQFLHLTICKHDLIEMR
jgi:hypothetical protein